MNMNDPTYYRAIWADVMARAIRDTEAGTDVEREATSIGFSTATARRSIVSRPCAPGAALHRTAPVSDSCSAISFGVVLIGGRRLTERATSVRLRDIPLAKEEVGYQVRHHGGTDLSLAR
ncbi:MAG: hypothetical protein IPL72_20005 [Sulfuritalea sp.]|nr:hypothetical protein [Sulfuritalea sp.]